MRTRSIIAFALLVFLGLIIYGLWPERSLRSVDLHCAAVSDARAAVICHRLEQEMEWTWLGHAIIAPGWRVTFRSVKRTYCAEKVGMDDLPSLERLRRATRDWRAELGADFLIRLVRNKDGGGDEPANSIFNPDNPAFVLRGGCNS